MADWPEIRMFRRAEGYPLYKEANSLGTDEGEIYLPLSKVRERLLSDEAIRAAIGDLAGGDESLIGTFCHSERVAAEELGAAIRRALTASFPEEDS